MVEIMKRPTSISVVAWFLIVTAAIALPFQHRSFTDPLAQELMARSLLPVSLQIVMAYVGLAVAIGCGVGMLKGADWSRKVYLGWSVLGLIVAVVTSPLKLLLIPGALIIALFIYFLFRPQASAWFAPRKVANDA